MAVRSRRIAGPTAATAGGPTIYTVPAGRTARGFIMFTNVGPAIQLGVLRVNGVEFWRGLVPADSTTGVNSVILDPLDVLSAASGGAQPMNVTYFGSLLLGAPA